MRPRVKICGITNYDDAALALELGADAIGFVMAPSPRRIAPDEAALILERLRFASLLGPATRGAATRGAAAAGKREAVCVFVNENPETMSRIVLEAGFDWAQIHGDETPEECARFAFPWYRALRASDPERAASIAALPWDCPRLLFDAAAAGAYGGTGRSVPLAIALAARDAARKAG
ncbi:MAG: phosphoribosylanthranilate isomerase, partial [Spirochaetaceae bacterium]|nr:phosphoribosylanthranilate isomerase [Spirochaetaceae bacterium]